MARPRTYTHLVEDWKTQYLAGKVCKEIATAYKVNKSVVWWYLSREGVIEPRGARIMAERHPNWRGDAVAYCALHDWITSRLPKPELCEACNNRPPLDLANISQHYRRDLTDWEWLCRRCHMTKDGRMRNLKQYQS